MGFFSNIKNRARRQVAPVMPMAPQAPRPIGEMPLTPEQMARKAEFERNKAIENERNVISKYGSRENMERMIRDSFTNPIQNMPQRPRMPEALPPRRGPMNRGLPGLMNQMQGEPRMMMAVGGPLMGRAANLSRQVLSRNAGRNLPDRAMPGIGDRILGSPRGSLTYGPQQLNRIRNTENAIMAGGGLGVAGLMDATNMFSEPASVDNIGFMSPEAMGTDLANLRVGIDRVIDLARSKASEMGADINEYVDRTRSAYDQQMENQRMQELDAQQGMRPFSLLMGPDMPLSKPEPQQRQRQESLDDILADLEKKN